MSAAAGVLDVALEEWSAEVHPKAVARARGVREGSVIHCEIVTEQ